MTSLFKPLKCKSAYPWSNMHSILKLILFWYTVRLIPFINQWLLSDLLSLSIHQTVKFYNIHSGLYLNYKTFNSLENTVSKNNAIAIYSKCTPTKWPKILSGCYILGCRWTHNLLQPLQQKLKLIKTHTNNENTIFLNKFEKNNIHILLTRAVIWF